MLLAHELSELVSVDTYRCIVDRDLDHWFGPLMEVRGLRWTPYCALAIGFYKVGTIRALLDTASKCRVADWQDFLQSFEDVLLELYSLRLADRELDTRLTWISFDRCLTKRGNRVAFDSREYSKRLLNANACPQFQAQWQSSVSDWRSRLGNEPRLAIRDHDFIELLAWTIRSYCGLKNFADIAAIERLFVLMSDELKADIEMLVK